MVVTKVFTVCWQWHSWLKDMLPMMVITSQGHTRALLPRVKVGSSLVASDSLVAATTILRQVAIQILARLFMTFLLAIFWR